MQVPYEFEQFVKGFHPGSADGTATLEEWIAENLRYHKEDSKQIIRGFLDELLSARHTDADIEHVWRLQYPSYDFAAGGHRAFLMLVRSMLGQVSDVRVL